MADRKKNSNDKKGRQTPKDVENEKNGIFVVAGKNSPRPPSREETRGNNLAAVKTMRKLVVSPEFWIPQIEAELAEMNRGKVGHPYEYCDTMIIWMMVLAGYADHTVRMSVGLAQGILERWNIKAPSYNRYFERAMRIVGEVDRWEEGQPHILCSYALPCRDTVRKRRVGADSTGLNLSCVFRYRERKWKTGPEQRGWLKAHALFDIDSGEMLAFILTDDSVGDSAMLPRLLDLAEDNGNRMTVCYADGAYSGVDNWLAVCHEHGMEFVTSFKRNTNRRSNGCWEMGRAKKLWCELPYAEWVEASGYGSRWKVECGFSDIKRLISEDVRARTHQGMVREVLQKLFAVDFHKKVRADIIQVTGNGVYIGVEMA